MDNWACPQCGNHDRVIVTEGGTGVKTNRCLTKDCGYVEPWAPEETSENDA